MKKAFTLIELLVVIGIIAVLMGALLVASRGTTEAARAAKCQANMRSIAQACYSAAMKDQYRYYPHAGSTQYIVTKEDSRTHRFKMHYREHKGWISWLSEGYFDNDPTSPGSFEYPGCLADAKSVEFACTNGAIWQAVGANASCYKCPTMLKKVRDSRHVDMAWCYAMNGKFSYDASRTGANLDTALSGQRAGHMKHADKMLLLAELNLDDLAGGGNGDHTADPVLECGEPSDAQEERIGFNHPGKRTTYAHVVFADCHSERLELPKSGDLRDLTRWLCKGYDISFVNGEYRKSKDEDGK